MDPIEQDTARFKQPAIAVAGGIAAALVIATLPHVYLENIIGATGLSEIIPSAAPPLGNTARSLIAIVTGMISASALFLFLNHTPKFHGGGSDMGLAIRNNLTTDSMEDERDGKSRFAVPKLSLSAKSFTKFLRKPKKSAGRVTDLKDLPDVRPADRHPDAPARQPIFASSDLGAPLAEKIQRFDQSEVDQDLAEPAEKSAPPVVSPPPFVAEKILHSPTEEEQAPDRSDNILQQQESVVSREDLTGLSIAQLTDRLEAGLRRLTALAMTGRIAPSQASPQSVKNVGNDMPSEPASETPAPVAIPPLRSVDSPDIDVQDNRQADMDAALKAALGTLERMTVQR